MLAIYISLTPDNRHANRTEQHFSYPVLEVLYLYSWFIVHIHSLHYLAVILMHQQHHVYEELSCLKGITYASLNICSVYRKLDDIKLLLKHSKSDSLFLSETWLNRSVGDLELAIPGY